MTTKQVRAKKGGQVGLNGEWYFGGQFLAQSAYTIKGELRDLNQKKVSKPRKEEIAPYKWELPPTETARPIFAILSGGYIKRLNNGKMERFDEYIALHGDRILGREVDELIEMWNNGIYWFEPIAD